MSNIVEKLRETKSLRNKLLAAAIERRQQSNTFRIPQDIEIERKNEQKAYSLLKRLVTPDVKEQLIELDETIEGIKSDIYETTGWWMTGRTGFMYEDNFQNMHDHEFRSWDTYRLYRDEEGYYVSEKQPFNSYFASLKMKEHEFLEEHKEELKVLHKTLSTKEELLGGNIPLKDEKNRELIQEIVDYLGYKKEEKQKEKTKI